MKNTFDLIIKSYLKIVFTTNILILTTQILINIEIYNVI